MATVTGQAIPAVIRQPASLTLWTYWQLLDSERIERLMARSDRFDAASLSAVASWDGKMFAREQASFRRELQRHPDPDVERRLNQDAIEQGLSIIARDPKYLGGAK